MSRIGRRLRNAVNPVSTAVTRWWCHSATRYMLSGHGAGGGRHVFFSGGTAPTLNRKQNTEQVGAHAATLDAVHGQDNQRI